METSLKDQDDFYDASICESQIIDSKTLTRDESQQENEIQKKYNKERFLGRGAFGKVFLVVDNKSGDYFVMKKISTFGKSQQEIETIFKEAEILKQLDHPNIISFKEVVRENKDKFKIIMEYADGGDLAHYLKSREGQLLPEISILEFFYQICYSLQYLQSKKIIHRDLKCDNIFLTKDNTVKLGDFGIAKVLQRTVDKAVTFVGTPYYLSPEILENKPYSFQSDIWSLGVILYELCTLTKPFDATSLHLLALKIIRGKYHPISNVNLSMALKNLVQSLLQVQPQRRPTLDSIIQQVTKQLQCLKALNEKAQKKTIQIIQQSDKAKKIAQQKFLQNKLAEEKKKQNLHIQKIKLEEEKIQKKKERDEERKKMNEDILKRKKEFQQLKDRATDEPQIIMMVKQPSDNKSNDIDKKLQTPYKVTKKKVRDIPVEIYLPKLQNAKNQPKVIEINLEEQKQACIFEQEVKNMDIAEERQGNLSQSQMRELNKDEEKSLILISTEKISKELRQILEDALGVNDFMKAYKLIEEDFDLDILEEKFSQNAYQDLFPFLSFEKREKYLSYLFTLLTLEKKQKNQY